MASPATIIRYTRALAYIRLMHDQPDFTLEEVCRRFKVNNGFATHLRALGVLETTGRGKNARHQWVGPEPTPEMAEQILKLTSEYNRRMAQHTESAPTEIQLEQPTLDPVAALNERLARIEQAIQNLQRIWA